MRKLSFNKYINNFVNLKKILLYILMSTDNKVVEIKTIDFSLVNLNNDATICKNTDVVLLENKIDLIENKLNEQIETNEVILKKLNFDNLFSDQTNTLSVEVENLKKNVRELNEKLEEAELIRQIVNESISNIFDSKLEVQMNPSNEINKNILEVDLIVKENRMEINNLKSNIQNIIEEELEKLVQNNLNDIIKSNMSEQINLLLEDNNKKIIDTVNQIISNKINNMKVKEEVERAIEQQKEEEENKQIIEQQKEEEDKQIIEQQNMDEEEAEAKRIMEEQNEAKLVMEQQKKADEEEELEKVANEDVVIYPTTGYTMYLFIDTKFDLNSSSILVFINKDKKYELRAKTNVFKNYNDKPVAVLNIQLENNEDSFLLRLDNSKGLKRPIDDIYSKFDTLTIGKNNLTNNILNIPAVKF